MANRPAIQEQVKLYIQDEFEFYPPYLFNHIGWIVVNINEIHLVLMHSIIIFTSLVIFGMLYRYPKGPSLLRKTLGTDMNTWKCFE